MTLEYKPINGKDSDGGRLYSSSRARILTHGKLAVKQLDSCTQRRAHHEKDIPNQHLDSIFALGGIRAKCNKTAGSVLRARDL